MLPAKKSKKRKSEKLSCAEVEDGDERDEAVDDDFDEDFDLNEVKFRSNVA